MLFSGDPASQVRGNASVVYDLGSTGFLGVGSVSGLDDNSGRLQLLFAEEDEGQGTKFAGLSGIHLLVFCLITLLFGAVGLQIKHHLGIFPIHLLRAKCD